MSFAERLFVLGTGTALLSLALTAALIRLSVPLRLVARPRSDRWHKRPTPTTGGIAVVLACIAAWCWWMPPHSWAIAAGSLAIAVLGLVDDLVQLRPAVKLLGQVLLAAAVVAAGVVFEVTAWPFFNAALTWLWIVGITNAFNLIDNMDGLCAGVTVIICGFRLWTAISCGDQAGAAMAVIVGAAFLGFLRYNYNPARVFMGDCGSMFAGFSLATMAAACPVPHTKAFLSAILYPALTFLYPIFDTVLVSVLRRAAGRPISVGGRDHSSHRLVSLGHSEKRVVWLLWILTAAGAAVGMLTWWMPVGVHAIGTLLLAGVCVLGVFLGTLPTYPWPENAPLRAFAMRRMVPTLRAGVILVLDCLLAGVGLLTAFLLRWDNTFPAGPAAQFLYSLPVVMICYGSFALVFRTPSLGWRWFGTADAVALAQWSAVSAALSTLAIRLLAGEYSASVMLITAVLVFCFAAGLRASMHLLRDRLNAPNGGRKAAILGAGSWAEVLVLTLQKQKDMGASPACVLDTDPAADMGRIHGIPVYYAGRDPVGLLRTLGADLLLLPSHVILSRPEQRLVAACMEAGIPVEQFSVSVTPCRAGELYAEGATPVR